MPRIKALSLTDVVRVELVNTNERTEGGRLQRPAGRRTRPGELSRVGVVDQARVEPDVGVDDERSTEHAVEDRVGGGRDSKGGQGDGDQSDGEKSLELPVVGSVGFVGFGEGGSVVDRSGQDG